MYENCFAIACFVGYFVMYKSLRSRHRLLNCQTFGGCWHS